MSEPRYGERKQPERKPATPASTAGTIFWIVSLLALVVGPIAIFLWRWALGML